MLEINARPTFTRTAKFSIPAGPGFDEQSCGVTFAALDITEFNSFDLGKAADTERFLRQAVVSLDDLRQDGQPVPYSTAVLDHLLNQDWARLGLVRAYVSGRQKAAEGN